MRGPTTERSTRGAGRRGAPGCLRGALAPFVAYVLYELGWRAGMRQGRAIGRLEQLADTARIIRERERRR